MSTTARQLEDVSDDLIVDVIASFGIRGMCLYDKLMSAFLLALGFDVMPKESRSAFREAASAFRWYSEHGFVEWRTLAGRLTREVAMVYLTPEEWGRRLGGKDAAYVTAALRGSR
jgi:hypothetical protein